MRQSSVAVKRAKIEGKKNKFFEYEEGLLCDLELTNKLRITDMENFNRLFLENLRFELVCA